MPYFVYYIAENAETKVKKLDYIDEFDNFKAARGLAREKRSELSQESDFQDCRLIFAKNKVEAEKLLSAPREERIIGED